MRGHRRAPLFVATGLLIAGMLAGPVSAVDDVTPPTGFLQVLSADLASESGYSSTTALLARVIGATDAETGLDKLRISNSGASSGGMLTAYEELAIATINWTDLFDWSLSNTTGGSTVTGTHTIYAQWSDGAGNWTSISTAVIVYDTKVPSVTRVTIGFAASAPQSGIPIQISFAATESGRYTMQRQVDGGAWTVMSYALDSGHLVLGHSSSHTYRYRINIRDWAGHTSGWAYSTTFKPAHYAETSSKVHYHGSWTHVIYVGTSFITARATAHGAYATFTFTGKGIAWESILGPKRGKATIYVDGKAVKTVDLKAKTDKWAVAYSKTWSKNGKHTIKIKVLGTSGRPKVDIDGLGVLR